MHPHLIPRRPTLSTRRTYIVMTPPGSRALSRVSRRLDKGPYIVNPDRRVAPESRLGARFENTLRMSLILGGLARIYPQHPVGLGVLGVGLPKA